MATKAEWHRYLTERSGPKKLKQLKKKAGPEQPKVHNLSQKADRKAQYVLEDHAPGTRPSRKTSRKASNRQKTDVQFRMKREKTEGQPAVQVALLRGRR
ncbi:MAG TPA: hypothetical protein VFF02_01260 [Anaeromyxobacteraceae bacterium]|nr:hypothetical protein [Anaeromyxobacteraceae bacterium]